MSWVVTEKITCSSHLAKEPSVRSPSLSGDALGQPRSMSTSEAAAHSAQETDRNWKESKTSKMTSASQIPTILNTHTAPKDLDLYFQRQRKLTFNEHWLMLYTFILVTVYGDEPSLTIMSVLQMRKLRLGGHVICSRSCGSWGSDEALTIGHLMPRSFIARIYQELHKCNSDLGRALGPEFQLPPPKILNLVLGLLEREKKWVSQIIRYIWKYFKKLW